MVADCDSLRNFDLLLLAGFSFLAVTLAAVGVYAVMAYSVSRRTREIGIRIALGASSRDVLHLILQQGARLAIVGSVIGVAGSFLLRRIMASFQYGLSANDPLVLCLVPCLMISVIVLACWLPARRATKIDPKAALRWKRMTTVLQGSCTSLTPSYIQYSTRPFTISAATKPMN